MPAAQPVRPRRRVAVVDRAPLPPPEPVLPVLEQPPPPLEVLLPLVGLGKMRVHERHDHLDELAGRLHRELHLVVVVRLPAWRTDEAADAEHVVHELAHSVVDGTESDAESEATIAVTGEAALGGDEPAD